MHDHAFHGTLGTALKARRQELGLRQAELAEFADCSVRFVHMLEHGKPTARLDKILDVLEVLGLELTVGPARRSDAETRP